MISVIDIGTNTILMLTAELLRDASIRVVDDHHEIARLGRGVDATRAILPETFARIEGFLLRYRSIAESFGSARIVAFGTSALRDARNRDEFIAAMRERTGIEIELLSGDDEARWTYTGALFGLDLAMRSIAVLDIGGGSTELALGDGSGIERAMSIDIGAVRITERFFTALPPTHDQLNAARAWADEQIARLFDLSSETTLVGVAGTVTTLGAIAHDHAEFNSDALNGLRLTFAQIKAITDRLATMSVDEVAAVPQVTSGRADIILGGATILLATMRRFGLNEIVVSTRGVRYGIAMREAVRESTRAQPSGEPDGTDHSPSHT